MSWRVNNRCGTSNISEEPCTHAFGISAPLPSQMVMSYSGVKLLNCWEETQLFLRNKTQLVRFLFPSERQTFEKNRNVKIGCSMQMPPSICRSPGWRGDRSACMPPNQCDRQKCEGSNERPPATMVPGMGGEGKNTSAADSSSTLPKVGVINIIIVRSYFVCTFQTFINIAPWQRSISGVALWPHNLYLFWDWRIGTDTGCAGCRRVERTV